MKNKIKIYKNFALIYLYYRNGHIRTISKIDPNDVEKVSEYRWCAHKKRNNLYVYSHKLKISIHNLILGEKFIDHINRDTLDNRRVNLRKATFTEQNFNKPLQKNNKSGIKGVYFRSRIINGKKYSYWIAQFQKKHLGQFKFKKEAIKLRKEKEKAYGGII